MTSTVPTRLVYHSRIAEGVGAAELAAIVEASRMRNRCAGITGGLVLYRGVFMQVLEGDSVAIGDLFLRLLDDPRHEAVTLVQLAPVAERTLPEVWLTLLDDEEAVEELLARFDLRPPFDPRALDADAMARLVSDACLTRAYLLD